jgi:hypothetical protein
MKAALIALLFAVVLFGAAMATTWSVCPGTSHHLTVNALTLKPDPPVAGQAVDVQFSGFLGTFFFFFLFFFFFFCIFFFFFWFCFCEFGRKWKENFWVFFSLFFENLFFMVGADFRVCLDETLTGGEAEITILYHMGGSWLPIPVPKINLCTISGVSCPIAAGPHTFGGSVNVPSVTPQGQYKGNLTLVDSSNNLVVCLEWETTIS